MFLTYKLRGANNYWVNLGPFNTFTWNSKINRAKDFILISFIIHIYFVYIIIIGKFIIKKVKRRCNIPAQLKLRTVNQDERRLYT